MQISNLSRPEGFFLASFLIFISTISLRANADYSDTIPLNDIKYDLAPYATAIQTCLETQSQRESILKNLLLKKEFLQENIDLLKTNSKILENSYESSLFRKNNLIKYHLSFAKIIPNFLTSIFQFIENQDGQLDVTSPSLIIFGIYDHHNQLKVVTKGGNRFPGSGDKGRE